MWIFTPLTGLSTKYLCREVIKMLLFIKPHDFTQKPRTFFQAQVQLLFLQQEERASLLLSQI